MPNITSRIVEITVFRLTSGKPSYLLLKRSRNDDLYPGIWQIVTGFVEDGERTVDAALRELEEETGLRPERFWRLPFVNSFFDPVRDVIHLSPHFAARVGSQSEPVLSAEHEAHRWCEFEQTQVLLPWQGQRTGVRLVHEHFIEDTEESRLLEIHQLKRTSS